MIKKLRIAVVIMLLIASYVAIGTLEHDAMIKEYQLETNGYVLDQDWGKASFFCPRNKHLL